VTATETPHYFVLLLGYGAENSRLSSIVGRRCDVFVIRGKLKASSAIARFVVTPGQLLTDLLAYFILYRLCAYVMCMYLLWPWGRLSL
jgi:cytochrome bd-type quinol oxidase subunit 1